MDEPTAGVDPTGQIEVRKILLDIAHVGKKTVLLSSHNLDEVQRICNRIALIDRGEIKLYGDLEDLRQKMGRSAVVVNVSAKVPDTVLAQLKAQPQIAFREAGDTALIFEPTGVTEVSDIVSFLAAGGVKIDKVGRQEVSLEELYASILKEVEQ